MSTQTTRPYRKRSRAELEDETRLRITEATMRPARGDRAGEDHVSASPIAPVSSARPSTATSRTRSALVGACSAHWIALNPFPDVEAWAGIGDVDERLRSGLAEMYDWYERTETMVETAAARPRGGARRSTSGWGRATPTSTPPRTSSCVGRPERGARRRRVRAAIAHALEFETWRSLVRRQGLDRDDAVDLMTRAGLGGRRAPAVAAGRGHLDAEAPGGDERAPTAVQPTSDQRSLGEAAAGRGGVEAGGERVDQVGDGEDVRRRP